MDRDIIREALVCDKRNGCVAIYFRSRKDESNCLNKDQDRIIAYSNKNARYNGSYWEMDDTIQNVFTDMVLSYNKAYCAERSLRSAIEVAAQWMGETPDNSNILDTLPQYIEAYAESRVQEAIEKEDGKRTIYNGPKVCNNCGQELCAGSIVNTCSNWKPRVERKEP